MVLLFCTFTTNMLKLTFLSELAAGHAGPIPLASLTPEPWGDVAGDS